MFYVVLSCPVLSSFCVIGLEWNQSSFRGEGKPVSGCELYSFSFIDPWILYFFNGESNVFIFMESDGNRRPLCGWHRKVKTV